MDLVCFLRHLAIFSFKFRTFILQDEYGPFTERRRVVTGGLAFERSSNEFNEESKLVQEDEARFNELEDCMLNI